ncbi:hypothetical protein DFH08DRAFT_701453 [Mycena albidolilacea]|uniref:C2H2-type domain-containing protein n=1 Tax=Mycena albidolilacea TaxID=1033008 RepID=A0AAD7A025_9AGAR|nr:hypothetical protein DFH08DRAFT_701453 [Mycena albidolilacea]
MSTRRKFTPAAHACREPGCRKVCKSTAGLKLHRESAHPRLPQQSPPAAAGLALLDNNDKHEDGPASPPISPRNSPAPEPMVPQNQRGTTTTYHPLLDGTPCDRDGYDLPAGTLPPPWEERDADDYSPFEGRAQFEFAEFLFTQEKMAQSRVDRLAQLLAALYADKDPPFADHEDIYATVDAIQPGDVPWQSFSVQYTGPLPDGVIPEWMTQKYEVWFRSPLEIFGKQLANPDFKDQIDWAPKRIFKNGKRQLTDFFSGNWAWKQADEIAKDPTTHGAMFVPSIFGSDKTTVSVGTGNTEFYPLYGGLGNLFNSTRRAHRDGLSICAFLSIPKSEHLNHSLFFYILPVPHFASLYIEGLWDDFGIVGDLIPFTTGFPRADIHELITMDLLHQVIKGTFKDHVVEWVQEYIEETHESAEAARILADIDRRIAVTTPFPGLRHFHTGRGYKQWTGNDSKGLMKVYLPAIAGHVPSTVVKAVADIIEFCYLVRRSVIDEDTLVAIEAAIVRFHDHREIFRATSRPDGFSLPRQHSITHYPSLIRNFGAPNGLCSSITESKHIKAVKRPYRRTNHYKPLGQILLINQRLDKIVTARVDFASRGMLDGAIFPFPPPSPRATDSPLPEDPNDENVDAGAIEGATCIGEVKLAKTYVRKVPRDVHQLAEYVEQPRLCELIRRFLFDQLNPDAPISGAQIALDQCPEFTTERVFIFNSACAVFYAPSDVSGVGGMRHERIRATKSWYHGPPRYDCVFLEHDPDAAGFHGLHAARVWLFFRFKFRGVDYPCALIHWFSARGDEPCPDTGMWRITPDFQRDRTPHLAVVHLDSILRGAHLIGIAGKDLIPVHHFNFSDSLDAFQAFYVNKYADHHAHEIAF